MYKVVIVDDEPIIVEGISRIIPWSNYNCEVIASANSGSEGLEIIRTCKPDIVISDIYMPGMDGLAMIAAIKSEFPNTMVSILTGFRDFDFAQQAIRLGVSRFMLKPSNLDEIEEAVKAMTDKLNCQRQMQVECAEGRENKTEESDQESGENDVGCFIVNNAVQYIKENCTRKLTLLDVAERVYVSQWHLSKLLNRYMGKNFSEILNGFRIEEAKRLLKNPALRIGDISEFVGFIDTAHFSRVFKKIAGVSANEYRNSMGREKE